MNIDDIDEGTLTDAITPLLDTAVEGIIEDLARKWRLDPNALSDKFIVSAVASVTDVKRS